MREGNIVILGAGCGGLKVTQRLGELLGNQKENPIMLANKHNKPRSVIPGFAG
ncbi:hypothetical protein P378_12625 [Desulforamulus profundi]|uniref:FAD/NAD(P)-binding domain-containing protein n=1 Tax=Desulforamulus profundi TaxID=1383067 RepID=A0A2C6L2A9_9FIRM|nr:hypothetical protein [Desulforamulus profundi]PHJ38001.1 hypothetical protein P378_12625 [Desulforamulus profundi]